MYSPVIHEQLIPVLYHAARSRGLPMTKFVDALLLEALRQATDLPPEARESLTLYQAKQTKPQRRNITC